jgi:hypothetical protein
MIPILPMIPIDFHSQSHVRVLSVLRPSAISAAEHLLRTKPWRKHLAAHPITGLSGHSPRFTHDQIQAILSRFLLPSCSN